jgi:hypothetical protein
MHFFSIYLIFLATLGPGVYSASNRNEYQMRKNNVSGEQSAAGDDCLGNVGSLTNHNPIGLHDLLRGYIHTYTYNPYALNN